MYVPMRNLLKCLSLLFVMMLPLSISYGEALDAAMQQMQTLAIPEIQRITEKGKIVVLMTNTDYNPFFRMKSSDGSYKGIDMEMAQAVADSLGVKLEVKAIYKSYDDVVNAIAKGEGDIGISKMSYTIERSKKVLFSSPYVIFKKSLLINRVQLSKIDSKNSLKEIMNSGTLPIVVAPGSYDDFSLALFPKSKPEEVEKWDSDGIKKLLEGKYFAAFRDELRIKLVLRKNPQATLHLLPVILKDEDDPIRMIVNKECFGLWLWVNSYLSNNIKPYTYDELFARFGHLLKND